MSTLKFPYQPESDHPQYLWNEQEYIYRMLMQNSIGVSIDETSSQVTISLDPSISHNFIANGAADFPKSSIQETFTTNQTRWIYFKADTTEFYISSQQPQYNQYLHGWYHSTLADRAVVFIDSENPAGYRCIVMDSPNCHFEFNRRISNSGGELIFEATNPSELVGLTLTQGNYRIEIMGGKGGNGGGIYEVLTGGLGATAVPQIVKISILSTTTISCMLGADGENGQDGGYNSGDDTGTAKEWAWNYSRPSFQAGWTIVGGGGGSSGEDSVVLTSSNLILARGIGGAGGGGAMQGANVSPNNSQVPTRYEQYFESHGAGGGGAGSGVATAGNVIAGYSGTTTIAGQPGGAIEGGLGGLGNYTLWTFFGFSGSIFGRTFNQAQQSNPVTGNHSERGIQGQNLSAGFRRNGGNSKQGAFGPMGSGSGLVSPTNAEGYLQAKGGNTPLSTSNGHLRIYKTGNLIL